MNISIISEEVLRVLYANGWSENRHFDVTGWINILVSEGYILNSYAEKILFQLGNIKLEYMDNSNYEISMFFNPIFSASGEIDRMNDCYNTIGEKIFPIGEMYDYTIYASDSRRIYLSDWKSIALVGDCIEDFLNNMFNPLYNIKELDF